MKPMKDSHFEVANNILCFARSLYEALYVRDYITKEERDAFYDALGVAYSLRDYDTLLMHFNQLIEMQESMRDFLKQF